MGKQGPALPGLAVLPLVRIQTSEGSRHLFVATSTGRYFLIFGSVCMAKTVAAHGRHEVWVPTDDSI